eukprot:1736832-Rhodomonas_salina.4
MRKANQVDSSSVTIGKTGPDLGALSQIDQGVSIAKNPPTRMRRIAHNRHVPLRPQRASNPH